MVSAEYRAQSATSQLRHMMVSTVIASCQPCNLRHLPDILRHLRAFGHQTSIYALTRLATIWRCLLRMTFVSAKHLSLMDQPRVEKVLPFRQLRFESGKPSLSVAATSSIHLSLSADHVIDLDTAQAILLHDIYISLHRAFRITFDLKFEHEDVKRRRDCVDDTVLNALTGAQVAEHLVCLPSC